MFEYEQELVNALLEEDNSFKHLYDKYSVLKNQIDEAHDGAIAMDDIKLEQLKKQKLRLKDEMAGIIREYQRETA